MVRFHHTYPKPSRQSSATPSGCTAVWLTCDPNNETVLDLLLVLGSEAAEWSDSTTGTQSRQSGNQVQSWVAASCLADTGSNIAEAKQCALGGLAHWQAEEGRLQAGCRAIVLLLPLAGLSLVLSLLHAPIYGTRHTGSVTGSACIRFEGHQTPFIAKHMYNASSGP